jgi:hypothetical protein
MGTGLKSFGRVVLLFSVSFRTSCHIADSSHPVTEFNQFKTLKRVKNKNKAQGNECRMSFHLEVIIILCEA